MGFYGIYPLVNVYITDGKDPTVTEKNRNHSCYGHVQSLSHKRPEGIMVCHVVFGKSLYQTRQDLSLETNSMRLFAY